MTSQNMLCPQCAAPMGIPAGRKYCQCEYCGSKFVLEGLEMGAPHPVRFEAVLARTAEQMPLEEVEKHLAELELAIVDAEEEVEAKQAELAEARKVYRETIAEVQKGIEPVQVGTYAAGLLATVSWFLVVFVLGGSQWYAGLIIAMLLLFVAWGFYREWQEAERRGQGELREFREVIEEAKAAVDQAVARLADYTLEKELWQKRAIICQQEEE
ncbi:MAG: hypothetical protein H5T68_11270 [Chloroflexi bacterium]|nr:hypothetical protein [Chloroflexota bacterium]